MNGKYKGTTDGQLLYSFADNPYIELPDGASYSIPLYDPLASPIYVGNYPQIDLTRPTVGISVESGAGIQMDPIYERVNPFHVIIRYDMVRQDISGNYDITIREGSMVIARHPIAIEITGKQVVWFIVVHFYVCFY